MLLSFVPRQHDGHGTNKGGGEEAPSHSLGAYYSLGFRDQHEESITHPEQVMEFWGLCPLMTITLPNHKFRSLQRAASKLKHQGSGPVRQLAQVLGMMVAAHLAILPTPLYFRYLKRARARALKRA